MTLTEVFVRESLRRSGGITPVRSNGGNHELPSGSTPARPLPRLCLWEDNKPNSRSS